jgi:hypothetical protein
MGENEGETFWQEHKSSSGESAIIG